MPSIVIQDRDIEILKLVNDYRFLRSDQIIALLQNRQPKLRSNQVILKRLQKLFHNGLLDRPRDQLRYDMQGSDKMIYALGNGGADMLAETQHIARGKINWSKKNREVKRHYLNHSLMISDFRSSLTLALRLRKDMELLFWHQGEGIRDHVLVRDEKGDKIRFPVWPDGYFCLNAPRGKHHFFLEADQSTMTNDRFLKKMKAYWAFWQSGGHTKKYGIKSFRVLTITKSEARKENLLRVTIEADAKKKGSNLFMFACEKKYCLSQPQGILEPIWQTPAEEEYKFLLH